MLTVRIQAIDGTGTCTLLDSQPCRLLTSLHGNYSASWLLRTHPSPSRLSTDFPWFGYTVSLCSADFAAGRGGLLQLLGASLSSCCRYYPARVSRRIGQIATFHAAFTPLPRARPLGLTFSGPPVRLLSLRPDDSLTIPRMALSIDFRDSVSFLLTIQATGPLTFALAGLTPAEYTSFTLDMR